MLLSGLVHVCYNRYINMAIIQDKMKDLNLALQAQSGDQSAFGILYDAYVKHIYDFVYYKTLNKEVAEDITSIIFIKAWKNIRQFNTESFMAWLYSISRNAIIDYYRSNKGNINIEDCWDLADKSNFLEKIDVDLKIEKIKEAMKSLSLVERDIIIMRFWLDIPFKDIAERLGKNEGAVKMALSRSLKNLKNKIPLALIILAPGIINICKKLN